MSTKKIGQDSAFRTQIIALRIIKMRLGWSILGLTRRCFLPKLFFREDITGFGVDCTISVVTALREGNKKKN